MARPTPTHRSPHGLEASHCIGSIPIPDFPVPNVRHHVPHMIQDIYLGERDTSGFGEIKIAPMNRIRI